MKQTDATMYPTWLRPYSISGCPPRLSEVLNIFSMRSVIRKPLTMFVIDAKRAMAPRMRIRSG